MFRFVYLWYVHLRLPLKCKPAGQETQPTIQCLQISLCADVVSVSRAQVSVEDFVKVERKD